MNPVPGWYTDPTGAAELRWWDGATWTHEVNAVASTPPIADEHVQLASWWARVRAYLLDAFPLWLASLMLFDHWHQPLVNEIVGIMRVSILTGGGRFPPLEMWLSYGLLPVWIQAAIPGILLRVAYDVACLSTMGATFGHRSAGLRVAEQGRWREPGWTSKTALPWHRALRRSIVQRVLGITGIGFLACVLWPLVDPGRRSLADLAGGTQVVDIGDVSGTPIVFGR